MKYAVSVLTLLAASAASAASGGIQNGGFETTSVSPGGYLYAADAGFGVPTVAPGSTPAASWTFTGLSGVSANAVDWSQTQVASEGSAYAFLQTYAGVTGSISQSFALAGAVSSLRVSFEGAQRNFGTDIQSISVSVLDGHNVLASQLFTPNQSWGAFSLSMGSLSAGTYTLSFSGVSGLAGDRSAFIDNVSMQTVAAVPEADTISLSVAGLMVVGLLARRRRVA